MDSGYYAAMTGLIARSQALDTAAANLANVNTPGYRAERDYFRSVLLDTAPASQLGQAVNNFGLLGGDRLSFSQGPIGPTGNSLDLAIQGFGFFQIQTREGPRFTRDGSFHRSQAGALVTSRDEAVLSTGGKGILIPPGEVSVGSDGVVSVAGGTVDTIGIFTFPASVQLTAEGTDRYAAPQSTAPQIAKDATVRQGSIELANQDPIQGTLDLVMMQRQAEMMQKALTVFHTEFNKFASEDLARV